MRRFVIGAASVALLGVVAPAFAENDPLSTKRRPALQRKVPEPAPRIGQPSHEERAAEREDWKQIEEMRASGKRGPRGGKGGGDDERDDASDD